MIACPAAIFDLKQKKPVTLKVIYLEISGENLMVEI